MSALRTTDVLLAMLVLYGMPETPGLSDFELETPITQCEFHGLAAGLITARYFADCHRDADDQNGPPAPSFAPRPRVEVLDVDDILYA